MTKKQPKAGISGDYRVVPIDQIQGNPRNPNQQNGFIFGKLVDSIREYGLNDPIIVRNRGEDQYEVIGGHHRLKAAQKLGMAQVPIVDLGQMDDVKADRLMIVLNETKGSADHDALAALVQQIKDTGGDTAIDLLPFTDAQLQDLLDETDVPVDDSEDVDEEPPVERAQKLKASDVGAVLEIDGATQDDIAKVVKVIRKWRTTKSDEAPAWYHLITLLREDRKAAKAAAVPDEET